MTTGVLLWALWVSAGGPVNTGYLRPVEVAAYFAKQADCERVQKIVTEQVKWAQCIQAEYILPSK